MLKPSVDLPQILLILVSEVVNLKNIKQSLKLMWTPKKIIVRDNQRGESAQHSGLRVGLQHHSKFKLQSHF